MRPSNGDISAMKDLLLRLNGEETNQPQSNIVESASRKQQANFDNPVDLHNDMKNILNMFHGVSDDAAKMVVSEAKYDPVLREALVTKPTAEGAIIGSWEVRAKLAEGSSKKKSYDVVNPVTNEKLFNDLVIFEAAHAIVRYLNKGVQPNNSKIEEIADLEELYRRNRQDAAVFKSRYNRCLELNETAAGEVFEARYQKAKAQAIVANDQIVSILKNIR